ncbi:MAG: hypothetical protein AAFO29_20650 [Actinomycetota bacterium]
MVLTTMVLMAVTLLTVTMFIGARRSLVQARLDTDGGRAEAAAELAVSEAFARIDGGESLRFVGEGSIGNTHYRYTADRIVASTWSVRAEGSAGSTGRAIEVTISRESRYPHTLFAVDQLISRRNTGTVEGRVGTNGSITIRGISPGEVQEVYRPDGTCQRCANPLDLDGPHPIASVVAPSDTFTACPIDGRFTGAVDGGGGVPYRCDDPTVPLWFDGEVTVTDPPFVLHVGDGVAIDLDGATANQGGAAADLQLFLAGGPGEGDAAVTATGAAVTGLLYGPGRSLTTADTAWTGSIILSRIEVARNGRLTVREDPTIESLGNDRWRIVELRSVPSNR